MKLKFVLVALFVVSTTFLLYFLRPQVIDPLLSDEQQGAEIRVPQPPIQKTAGNPIDVSQISAPTNVGSDIDSSNEMSDEEIAEANEWLLKQGFGAKFTRNSPLNVDEDPVTHDYFTYDQALLESMANSDPLAAVALATRLYENHAYEEARPLLESSALQGYASALPKLYHLNIIAAEKLDIQGNKEAANKMFVEGLAWAHIYNLRFYPDSDTFRKESLNSVMGRRAVELKEKGKLRGLELYEELKQKRIDLGLPEFDNDIPASMNPGS